MTGFQNPYTEQVPTIHFQVSMILADLKKCCKMQIIKV